MPVCAILGHEATQDRSTGNPIAERVIVHVRSAQSPGQPQVCSRARLGHLHNRPPRNRCETRRIIGARDPDHIIPLHRIPVSIAHRQRKRLGDVARRIERLNRCGVFCEGIGSRRPGHRQRAVGPASGHGQGVPGDRSTDNAVGKRLHIHIDARQRTAQPGLVRRKRLIHLGDRPFGDGRQDSRIIRTGHSHRVIPTHW